MDLQRFIRVAWRFKLLLAVGLALATSVAALSVVKIGSDGISYREPPVYTSAATLFVTQAGFPWGRAILDEMITVDPGKGVPPTTVPRFGDPGRYSGLAALYAELAKSDEVRVQALKGAGPGEYYTPTVAQTPGSSTSLPMIYMQGFGSSPQAAEAMANRSTKAFIDFIEREQRDNDIESGKKVEVTVTQSATPAEIFEARSFVRPIFMFLLVAVAFLALAFGLENLRPRPPRAQESAEDAWPDETLWPPDAVSPGEPQFSRSRAA
jgi:hypothetical protein